MDTGCAVAWTKCHHATADHGERSNRTIGNHKPPCLHFSGVDSMKQTISTVLRQGRILTGTPPPRAQLRRHASSIRLPSACLILVIDFFLAVAADVGNARDNCDTAHPCHRISESTAGWCRKTAGRKINIRTGKTRLDARSYRGLSRKKKKKAAHSKKDLSCNGQAEVIITRRLR